MGRTYDAGNGTRGATGDRAVVVIHGIGEQRPMATLRGFAAAVFGRHRTSYAVPDLTDDSYELHTLVVPDRDGGGRTDLYEAYWAPETHGTRLAHVKRWLRGLVLGDPRRLPSRVRRLAWRVGVGLLVLAGSVGWLGPDLVDLVVADRDVAWAGVVGKLTVAVLAAAAVGWLTRSLGDAARYLDVHPHNVVLRQAVRGRVVRLLEELHDSGRYDRIVVIGHSLGGVIAYDAVRLLWRRRSKGCGLDDRLDDEEVASSGLSLVRTEAAGRPTEAARERFHQAQARWFDQLAERHPGRWLVSDLVTLGSPVAHAAWLLSEDADDLAVRVRERELPTCPAQPARPDGTSTIYDGRAGRRLHHGAVFTATRWTNAWFPGDPVGGPVAALGSLTDGLHPDAGLGCGVHDVELPGPRGLVRGLWWHGRYWTDAAGRDVVTGVIAGEDERVAVASGGSRVPG